MTFAREFSKHKTPARRTQGWTEQKNEKRGHNDFMDTVGTLMFWKFLADNGIHCTYFLTGNGGDETDIRVHCEDTNLDIYVKTSEWHPKDDSVLPRSGHI